MSKKAKFLLIVVDIVLLIAIAVGVFINHSRSSAQDAEIGASELSRRYAPTLDGPDGEKAEIRRHLSTVLLIGTDNYAEEDDQFEVDLHFNFDMCDYLIVLVFDHEAKTVTPVQINRDTMCEVFWISVNGIADGTTEYEQICSAHTYGPGGTVSCRNTVKTVSSFLYGVPIDNYFAFTMDAVPIMNDAVGGVTVELAEDLPVLGKDYVRGAHITLKGPAALRFVRTRDVEDFTSNRDRMARHRQYMTAFTEAARSTLASDSNLAMNTFNTLKPYICTDLSVEQFSDMVERLSGYEMLPTMTYEGEYIEGEFAEFYPDEASLWACVRKAFCS